MVALLAKIFIKSNDLDNPETRSRYGMLSGFVGIFLNICLFIGKYIAGVLCGSIAIMADAFNNLSDAGSSVITLIGFKFAGKKPDADHPFGHGRIEYITGLVVAEIILLMGIELFRDSVDKIIHPVNITVSYITIAILVVSILVKIYMYSYNSSLSKKLSSPTMKATAMDSLSDTIATSVVLAATIMVAITGINLDGFGGVLVAIFIVFAGIGALKDTLGPLLGEPPTEEFVKQVEDIVMSYDEIVGIHDLVVHDYGPGRVFISLHGEVSGNEDIYMLHDAIDRIEVELSEKLHCEAIIHMDPIDTKDETVQVLKKEIVELIHLVDSSYSIHDFRVVKGNTHTNLIFDVLASFDVAKSDEEIKKEITNKIQEKWPNYYAVLKVDRDYVKCV